MVVRVILYEARYITGLYRLHIDRVNTSDGVYLSWPRSHGEAIHYDVTASADTTIIGAGGFLNYMAVTKPYWAKVISNSLPVESPIICRRVELQS